MSVFYCGGSVRRIGGFSGVFASEKLRIDVSEHKNYRLFLYENKSAFMKHYVLQ